MEFNPALSTLTLDVDGCDIYLPGSDFFTTDAGKEFFYQSDTTLSADPKETNSKCQWLQSPASMSADAVDCVVVQRLVEMSQNFDYATNTLTIRRLSPPTLAIDFWSKYFSWEDVSRDVWIGSAQCKIYVNAKSFTGDILIKPTSRYNQKSRVVR